MDWENGDSTAFSKLILQHGVENGFMDMNEKMGGALAYCEVNCPSLYMIEFHYWLGKAEQCSSIRSSMVGYALM